MGFEQGTKSITGELLNLDDLAIPCGLIAKSYFNDKFKDWKLDGKNITVNEKDIAWSADKKLKYKKQKNTYGSNRSRFICSFHIIL